MSSLLEQAISSDSGDCAAKIIQHALGIESDQVAHYVFPKNMAGRPRTAHSHHRGMVADRGALFGIADVLGCTRVDARRPQAQGSSAKSKSRMKLSTLAEVRDLVEKHRICRTNTAASPIERGTSGDEKDRIGAFHENINYRKGRFTVQPNVEDGAKDWLPFNCGKRRRDLAKRSHYLRAQRANKLIQLHGGVGVIFDKYQNPDSIHGKKKKALDSIAMKLPIKSSVQHVRN